MKTKKIYKENERLPSAKGISRYDQWRYIVIICNGDFSRIGERRSSLTWFEEWFLYFEWKFGQTARRQVDLEKAWGIHNPRINAIKDHKAAIKEQQ